MEHLIAEYLFKNKKCALLKAGTLILKQTASEFSVADKMINPPKEHIEFLSTINNSDSFVEFIQHKMNCTQSKANELLNQFCDQLNHLTGNQKVSLESLGDFYLNEAGELKFNSIQLPEIYQSAIQVNRVVHPKSTHQVRVGDNEKSNAYMQGYLKDSKVKKGNQWLMFILVILLLVVTILIHYFTHLEEYGQQKKSTKFKSNTVESVR